VPGRRAAPGSPPGDDRRARGRSGRAGGATTSPAHPSPSTASPSFPTAGLPTASATPPGPGKTQRPMTPVELLTRLAALVPPPRFPLLRHFGVFAPNRPWRSAVVPRAPDTASTGRRGPGAGAEGTAGRSAPSVAGSTHIAPCAPPRTADAGPAPRSFGEGDRPLFAVPTPLPRTLSAEHWRRLGDGRRPARRPRLDSATLLHRTGAEGLLVSPPCRGCMAVLVTGPNHLRDQLGRPGLAADPATFAPRATRTSSLRTCLASVLIK